MAPQVRPTLKKLAFVVDPMDMLVRFVTDWTDHDSGESAGLFLAASWARDHCDPGGLDLERLADLREWFNQHLERPARFNRSRRPHRKKKAISWFKDSACEHIRRAREIAELISAAGLPVREVKTERPGYVVYEDDFQVVAEPFAETER